MGVLAVRLSRGTLGIFDASTGGPGARGALDGAFDSFLAGLLSGNGRGSFTGTSIHIMVRRKRVKPFPERFSAP